MGRAVTESINNSEKLRIVAGVDVNAASLGATCDFPVYQSISDFPDKADVIIASGLSTGLLSRMTPVQASSCST